MCPTRPKALSKCLGSCGEDVRGDSTALAYLLVLSVELALRAWLLVVVVVVVGTVVFDRVGWVVGGWLLAGRRKEGRNGRKVIVGFAKEEGRMVIVGCAKDLKEEVSSVVYQGRIKAVHSSYNIKPNDKLNHAIHQLSCLHLPSPPVTFAIAIIISRIHCSPPSPNTHSTSQSCGRATVTSYLGTMKNNPAIEHDYINETCPSTRTTSPQPWSNSHIIYQSICVSPDV